MKSLCPSKCFVFQGGFCVPYLWLPFINKVIKMDCPSAGHKVIYSAFFPKTPYLGFAIKQRIDRQGCFCGYLSMDHRQVFQAVVEVITVLRVSCSRVPSAAYTLGPRISFPSSVTTFLQTVESIEQALHHAVFFHGSFFLFLLSSLSSSKGCPFQS